MRNTLVEYLRRTALHEIPVEREPDRGREIDDLVEPAETRERPAAGNPKGGGSDSLANRD